MGFPFGHDSPEASIMFNHYLITALRGLRSSPFISTVHIVGLSLGLACFIGAYATVRYIESSDTQFATADRAYTITQRIHSPQGDFDTGAGARTAPVVARHLVQELPELEAIARVETLLELDVRVGDRKTKLAGAVADADFFKIFPFMMQRGSASDPLREPRSVVLTADTAIRLFGTRDVIGKTVTLKKAIDLSITGVIANVPAPSQFDKTPLSSIPFDVLASMDVL